MVGALTLPIYVEGYSTSFSLAEDLPSPTLQHSFFSTRHLILRTRTISRRVVKHKLRQESSPFEAVLHVS
jgi:hypothetical protein